MTERVSFGIVTLIFIILSVVRMVRKCCNNKKSPFSSSLERDLEDDEIMSKTDAADEIETVTTTTTHSARTRRALYAIRQQTQSSSTTATNSIHNRLAAATTATQLGSDMINKSFWKSMINYSITFNSSFLIVGGLSESYLYGVRMIGNILSVCLGQLYCALIVYPFMYSLDASCRTPYDYLKLRYNRESPKIVCLIVGLFYYFSFLSLYLWGCAAILNILVPEIDLQLANVVLGLFSAIATLFGGFTQSTKTNLTQFLVAFLGIVFAMKLTLERPATVDSIYKAWDLAHDHNRTTLFDLSVDITTRYTILNQLVSLPLPWCSKLGLFLPNYIRYRSIRSKSKSRLLFLSSLPFTILFNLTLILAGGLFCFVYFYSCDLDPASKVANKNQIGIYWLHSILSSQLPTISGVVFACIVYHAVVQHSMGITLIAQLLSDEITAKLLAANHNRTKKLVIEKFISLVIGLSTIPYSALFQYSRNTMLSLFYIFNNSLNSPILGLFLLSMFNPYANHFGALAAFLLNIAINSWMVLGNLVFSQIKSQEFKHHVNNCNYSTNIDDAQFNNNNNNVSGDDDDYYYPKSPLLNMMYSVAPIWYCLFSVLFSFIVGSLLSLLYSVVVVRNKKSKPNRKSQRDYRKYMFFYRFKNHF